MVISERIAQLYFGEQDPVGKALRWDSSYDVEITGVFEHPSNTHFRHDLLVSMRTMEVEPGYHFTSFDSWVHGSLSFYVLLARGASRREFGADLLAAAEQVAPDRQLDRLKEDGGLPFLRSVRDLHLHQDGRNRHVYILATIGVFVLLVACVNFINLCTARSSQRAREVGIRKAAGAQQGQLASQFLVGSALQVLVAAGLGWLLAWTCGPAYEALTGFQLQIFRGGYSVLWPCLALATVALLGAGFPALVLARMHPARVFRDASRSGPLVVTLRRRLVEFQFVLAILLTLGTTVVYRQLEFIRHSDLGFRKEQVITFKAMSEIPNG